VKCVHIIKCAKVRALFAENKVRFALAEQLCSVQKSLRDKSCSSLPDIELDFNDTFVINHSRHKILSKSSWMCNRNSFGWGGVLPDRPCWRAQGAFTKFSGRNIQHRIEVQHDCWLWAYQKELTVPIRRFSRVCVSYWRYLVITQCDAVQHDSTS